MHQRLGVSLSGRNRWQSLTSPAQLLSMFRDGGRQVAIMEVASAAFARRARIGKDKAGGRASQKAIPERWRVRTRRAKSDRDKIPTGGADPGLGLERRPDGWKAIEAAARGGGGGAGRWATGL